MNLDQLKKEITADEGRVEEIYLDSEGYKTYGVGHLVLETEKEHKLPVGHAIPAEKVDAAFECDLREAIIDCHHVFDNWTTLPDEVQYILVNMMFNLGRTRLSKFLLLRRAIRDLDWNKAAKEMMDSKWYHQVPNRAQRLVERMKNV